MEEITLKGWRLGASVVDSDILRVEIDSQDGTEIVETGYAGQGGKDGDQYVFRFTTQQIEEEHSGIRRRPADTGDESDVDAEEDETIYLRGWEVTALVDEEGLLHLQIEKGLEADIYETDPIESNQPLGPRVVLKLAAEDLEEDDEAADDEDDDVDTDVDVDADDLGEEDDADVDDLDDDEDDAYEEDYTDELEGEADEYGRYGRAYRDSDYF